MILLLTIFFVAFPLCVLVFATGPVDMSNFKGKGPPRNWWKEEPTEKMKEFEERQRAMRLTLVKDEKE